MERLTQYAAAQGLENPELFCDWGFSSITQDRPEYKCMIRAIEAGNVSDLVVLDYSRLGRGYHTCSRLVEVILPKHGVTFHAVRNGVIYTPKALNELAAQRKAVYAVFRQMRRERGRQSKGLLKKSLPFTSSSPAMTRTRETATASPAKSKSSPSIVNTAGSPNVVQPR